MRCDGESNGASVCCELAESVLRTSTRKTVVPYYVSARAQFWTRRARLERMRSCVAGRARHEGRHRFGGGARDERESPWASSAFHASLRTASV